MKHILTLLAILICQCTFGQIQIKEINKSLAKINDTLYASKYEVSNQLYGTFVSSLRKTNKENLLTIAKIDSLKWLTKDSYNKPYE